MAVFAVTERVRLRRLSPQDLEALLAYHNDPEVARYQTWESISREDGEFLIEEQQKIEPGVRGRWAQVAVERIADGVLLGDLALHVERDDPRLGEVGFTFAREAQGQGYAAESVRALLDLAFGRLRMHRIKAVVDTRNEPAVRLLERLGFRREAHFRQHLWFKGAWCDEFVYAMLGEEWGRRDA